MQPNRPVPDYLYEAARAVICGWDSERDRLLLLECPYRGEEDVKRVALRVIEAATVHGIAQVCAG